MKMDDSPEKTPASYRRERKVSVLGQSENQTKDCFSVQEKKLCSHITKIVPFCYHSRVSK